MAKYVVTAKNRHGERIVTDAYTNRTDAQKYVEETKKHKWMKNPRVKKIK